MSNLNSNNERDLKKISDFRETINKFEEKLEDFQDYFEIYYINGLEENSQELTQFSLEEQELAQSTVAINWNIIRLKDDLENLENQLKND